MRVITLSSCANIIPPTGGKRDSLPPRLVVAMPKDSAVNVNTKNILLTFDEYIALENPQSNIIVSPYIKKLPEYDSKLRNMTIKIKDSLEANTTYSFDFGDAIRDVNEGNIAKKLTYVFSTGSNIDYNTYNGKVVRAEDGKTDSTLVVVLHRNLADSAITKLLPRYYTRINGKGEFTFYNLPKGDFAVYVVKNAYPWKYVDSAATFAFRNTPVTVGDHTPRDTLYAFEAAKRTALSPIASNTSTVKLSATNKDDKRLRYSSGLENGQQDLLSDLTLTFNRKLTSFDSTKFILSDTNYNKLNGYSVSFDSGKTKVFLKYKWKEATNLRFLIAKDAVADSLGTTLAKIDTIHFITKRETDYGSIRLRFTNLDLSKNPVLQFVQNNILLESVPLKLMEFQRKLYKPGTYELRILDDTNNNGIWDTGKFFGSKRQPEIVHLIPKQVAIRANWDNEVTITL
jgi:hypothetical protein